MPATHDPPMNREEELARQLSEAQAESNVLRHKLTRLERDNEGLSGMYENSEKLRSVSEAEKNLQYFYNRLFFEASPVMIFILDEQLCYLVGTSVFMRFLGFDDDHEMMGLRFETLLARVMEETVVADFAERCRHVLESNRPLIFEDKVSGGYGQTIYLQNSFTPTIMPDGRNSGVVVVMHDMTKLASMLGGARTAAQAKGVFLENMICEIRTPVNSIKRMSDQLFLTFLDDVQHGYAQNIISALDSLASIISDLLDFSKIEANTLDLQYASFDLGSILADAAELIGPQAYDKDLVFLTEIDPMLPAIVIGDDIRLKQVLTNLLSNAVKFTTQGYVKLLVKALRVDAKSFDVMFSVRDSGSGISPENIHDIFEPFAQVGKYQKCQNQNQRRTGLGLPICRSLIKMMGGELEVKSDYGEGAMFFFTIRLRSDSYHPIAGLQNPTKKQVLLLADGLRGQSYSVMLHSLFISFDLCSNEDDFVNLMLSHAYTHILYDYRLGDKIIKRHWQNIKNSQLIAIKKPQTLVKQNAIADINVLFEPVLVMTLSQAICGGHK